MQSVFILGCELIYKDSEDLAQLSKIVSIRSRFSDMKPISWNSWSLVVYVLLRDKIYVSKPYGFY